MFVSENPINLLYVFLSQSQRLCSFFLFSHKMNYLFQNNDIINYLGN